MTPLSHLTSNESRPVREGTPHETEDTHRRRSLRVLFIHKNADVIASCVGALEKGRYTVASDRITNLAQGADGIPSGTYDVVIAELPGSSETNSQLMQLLHQKTQGTPIVFLTSDCRSISFAELTAESSFECVEEEHIDHLPMAIRRAVKEQRLRIELDDARRALRHSQSLYRALADNPTYGIYRCDAEGRLLDVNQALIAMLGYGSKEEFVAANAGASIIPHRRSGALLTGLLPETQRIEPVELTWKRKDGSILKVRLSGRGIYDEHGNCSGHEMIAVDVTEQRTLEDQLRHEASCDSLTGLANHRRLFEVLHAEICRSQRTGREFSLLLLDLDGLKKINDQFGHQIGSRALCRVAQVIADCCRSVDTAARHGGDEFALVLPESSEAAATLVAQRICDQLAKDTEEPSLSVSVGVASYPHQADTIGTLLYAADRALYAMKSKKSWLVRSAGA